MSALVPEAEEAEGGGAEEGGVAALEAEAEAEETGVGEVALEAVATEVAEKTIVEASIP
jgi:hypothetical protein